MRVISIRTPASTAENTILDDVFRLRARVFHDRLNWKVSVVAGRERDEYDECNPHYIAVLGDAGEVIGTARLLPAEGPTMLERAFPVLLQQGRLEAHPRMVESSRFCVDTQTAAAVRGVLHETTLWLFAGIIDWSIASGYDEIVTATDLRLERLLRYAGWPLQRLGEPRLIDGIWSVAGLLPADISSFEKIKPPGYEHITRP